MSIEINNKKKNGFTLIELLATIAILAIVVSITLYVSLSAIEKSKEKSYKVTINNIQKEAANYLLENSDRLFFISDTKDLSVEYQCITVQNLIDMGYFDEDITESKIDKDTNVNTNMYVYIKRDRSTKVIKETALINDSNNVTCSQAVKAKGDISFVVEPTGWSKEKKITLYYSLNNLNDVTTIGDYKYDYEYDGTSENIYGNNTDTERQIKVTSNGTLEGYITLEKQGDIANKKLEVDKIDNSTPVITLGSNSDKLYTKNKNVKITIKDIESGLSSEVKLQYGWSNSDKEEPSIYTEVTLNDYTSGTTSDVTFTAKGSGLTGSYYLWVKPVSLSDVVGNSNTTVVKSTGIFNFDNTPPTKPNIDNPTNGNWTNSDFPLSVSTIEDGSGVDYWQYTYAENPSGNGDHNTSWVTYSNSSDNNFTTSPFSAERNQLVYIRVCDRVGNCSEVSNTYIRIDKTPPVIKTSSLIKEYKVEFDLYEDVAITDDSGEIASKSIYLGNNEITNYTSLALGVNTVIYKASDKAGNETSVKRTITIGKLTPTITLSDKTVTYNGNKVTVTAKSNSDGAITYKYYSGTSCSGNALSSAPSNAGSYSVKATTAITDTYYSGTKCAKITINKAKLDKPDKLAVSLGKSSKGGRVTWDAVSNATGYQISLDKSNYTDEVSGVNYWNSLAQGDTGNRTVYVRAIGNSNYEPSDWASKTVKLNTTLEIAGTYECECVGGNLDEGDRTCTSFKTCYKYRNVYILEEA